MLPICDSDCVSRAVSSLSRSISALLLLLFLGAQISSVYRRVKDKIDAKAASFHEGFVAGLLPSFGAGIGLMAKETSLDIREGNDTVIR